MLDHLIRGALILIIMVFGLPVLISLALGLMNNSRTNLKAASHFVATVLKSVVYGIADLADEVAKVIVKRYPEHPDWLQPAIKAGITAVVIVAALCLLSALN